MKKLTIPKLLLAGLMVVSSATAWGTQVKHVTFSTGSGHSQGTSHHISLTIGQSIAGKADHVAGNFMAGLGTWEMLSRTYIAAPVTEKPPRAINQLSRNYPNPFNPSTRISFSLEKESEVRIVVYDLQGRKVDTLLQEFKPAGSHSLTYLPKNLASGAYFVVMQAGSFRATQRMMLVK